MGKVPFGKTPCGLQEPGERPRHALGQDKAKNNGHQRRNNHDGQKYQKDITAHVRKRLLQDTDIEDTDDPAFDIPDRLISRQIPVCYNKGSIQPSLPFFDHLLVNGSGDPCADGALSVLVQDVRRDPDVIQKNRNCPCRPAFIHLVFKHKATDLVHQLRIPVDDLAAVHDGPHMAGIIKERLGIPRCHGAVQDFAFRRPGFRRRLDLDHGPLV